MIVLKRLSLMTNEKLVLGELIYLELKNYDPNIRLPIKEQSYSGIIRWGNDTSQPMPMLTVFTNTASIFNKECRAVKLFHFFQPFYLILLKHTVTY